jgi:hypothetical protein
MTGREDKLTQLYSMFPQIPSSYIKRLWSKYDMDARKCIDKLLKIQEYEKESADLNERGDTEDDDDDDDGGKDNYASKRNECSKDEEESNKRKQIKNGLIKEPPNKKCTKNKNKTQY